jgi:histidyl-tRNA synthetase
VILELLRAKNLLPNFSATSLVDIMVAVTEDDPALYSRAVKVASVLRREGQGWRVDLVLQPKRMKGVLQLANRVKAKRVVVFSSHEARNGLTNALVKSLGDGTQRVVCDSEILQTLQCWAQSEHS